MKWDKQVMAFAGLNGDGKVRKVSEGTFIKENDLGLCDVYDPAADYALQIAARDKFKIEIDYHAKVCTHHDTGTKVRFKHGLGRAVIECVLRSQSKWG